ncbi:MAG: arsenate reductase ArsC [Bacteroidia bacterium]|nr:arsenate reductase ArsC [Bacteroidia bacterium]
MNETDSESKKNILFVCIENSNRSQMAEAFAKIHGKIFVNAFSAGSLPSGKINPKAIEAMQTIDYDLTRHKSKSTDELVEIEQFLPAGRFDYVITMGCGDECPFIPAKHREDWDIPDPRDMQMKDFIKVRDLIEKNVKLLLKKISIEK